MSFFDKLRSSGKPDLTSKSAILLGCILMASADGEIDDSELAIIRRLDGDGSTPNWEAAVKAFRRLGRSEAVDAVCDSVSRDHVLPFIANLIDLAMADGSLAGAEKNLLETFCERLQPEDDFVEAAVGIIGIKNTLSTL